MKYFRYHSWIVRRYSFNKFNLRYTSKFLSKLGFLTLTIVFFNLSSVLSIDLLAVYLFFLDVTFFSKFYFLFSKFNYRGKTSSVKITLFRNVITKVVSMDHLMHEYVFFLYNRYFDFRKQTLLSLYFYMPYNFFMFNFNIKRFFYISRSNLLLPNNNLTFSFSFINEYEEFFQGFSLNRFNFAFFSYFILLFDDFVKV